MKKAANKSEYNKTVYDWNSFENSSSKDNNTVQQLFEKQVLKTPDKIAVVFEDNQLTYKELNEKSNQLANYIRYRYKEYYEEDLKGDIPIGIYAERSWEVIVGIFGILKAGGAYVPFDPADPKERLRSKIDDSGCKIILALSNNIEDLLSLPEIDSLILTIDDCAGEISQFSKENLMNINSQNDLAYIIYTSGSTGKPKGVMIEHKNVISFVKDNDYCPLGEDTVAVSFSSHVFDGSVFDIFSVLINGGKTIFPQKDKFLNYTSLDELLTVHKANTAFVTTSFFNSCAIELHKNPLLKLKFLLFGGEKVNKECVRKFLSYSKNTQLIHVYGPTETTVYATKCILKNADICPIGTPLKNTTVYVLDAELQNVPVGVTGELYIGGDGVARGYLNRADLTANRFITNPFASDEDRAINRNLRIYKTEDFVRYLPDRNIEYIERHDDQVKLRGFRIELGEIESKLSEFNGIIQSIVLCKEKDGNKYLAAYYTSEKKQKDEEVVAFLSSLLPDYMIPSAFIHMNQFPINVNGKIDKQKLPAFDFKGDEDNYVAPSTDIEKDICKIWKDLFGISKIGINDDFFRLGGNSLKAIAMVNELQSSFDIKISDIYKYKTVSKLAQNLTLKTNSTSKIDIKKAYENTFPLIESQRRFVHFKETDVNNVAIAVRINGELNKDLLFNAIDTVLIKHPILAVNFAKNAEGKLMQFINKDSITVTSIESKDQEIFEHFKRFNKNFDLQSNLCRFQLVKVNTCLNYLFIVVHHSIFDGYSIDILLNDIFTSYGNSGSNVSSSDINFLDYVYAENYDPSINALFENSKEFWIKKFNGNRNLTCSSFKPDFNNTIPGKINRLFYDLDENLLNLIDNTCERLNISRNDYFTAVYAKLLSLYNTSQDHVLLYGIFSGRTLKVQQDMIGVFTTALPILFADLNNSYENILNRTHDELLNIIAHQNYAIEDLAVALGIDQTSIVPSNFINYIQMKEVKNKNLKISLLDFDNQNAGYFFAFIIRDYKTSIKLCFEYNPNNYSHETVKKITEKYIVLLKDFLHVKIS